MKLFVCGDVMTGRGVDRILRHPGNPDLHESYVKSAETYVELAEAVAGPIPRRVAPDYLWGDALAEIAARAPDARIANLETAITARGTPEAKGINYRMHPENIACLTAAGLDCCVLANNHLGDWGLQGALDTFDALDAAGIAIAGAGGDAGLAARPAVLETPAGRLLVFAVATPSAGVPANWAASSGRAGVNFLADLDDVAFRRIAGDIQAWQRAGDTIVLSIHWGPNWGHDVPVAHRRFARRLTEEAGVDIVHGHSAHHPLGVELHAGRPALYGCGDFINDYEGISGHEEFRPELTLAWMLDYDTAARRLRGLEMIPFRLRGFRLERARCGDVQWLAETMDRECRRFGAGVELTGDATLALSC